MVQVHSHFILVVPRPILAKILIVIFRNGLGTSLFIKNRCAYSWTVFYYRCLPDNIAEIQQILIT